MDSRSPVIGRETGALGSSTVQSWRGNAGQRDAAPARISGGRFKAIAQVLLIADGQGGRDARAPLRRLIPERPVGRCDAGNQQFLPFEMMSGSEHVVAYEVGTTWSTTGAAYLMQTGEKAIVVVKCHEDDVDRRWVVIRVHGCCGVTVGPPGDEARSGHRLYPAGLDGCVWAGEVLESIWISEFAAMDAVHPLHRSEACSDLRHWILLFGDSTLECVGTSLSVSRESTISFPDLTAGP